MAFSISSFVLPGPAVLVASRTVHVNAELSHSVDEFVGVVFFLAEVMMSVYDHGYSSL